MNEPSIRRTEAIAAGALLVGTVCWGCGFTWAKAAGEAVQQVAGLAGRNPFGPIFLLAWRFLLAGVTWALVFPAARRGWTVRGVMASIPVGVLLGAALIVQHVGLDRTSEAVSAFLTSLTILFVPMLMTFVVRRPLRPVLWVGVGLATVGVWLMTGASPHGFGTGELLGLACAFLFSLYILAVNAASRHESAWRMVTTQFLITALMCFAASACVPGGAANLHASRMAAILSTSAVWINLILLTVFTTLVAFGLLTFYQPKIDPTRAALIYLAEPIFATAYAALAAGHRPGPIALSGAVLILLANGVVEVISGRGVGQVEERVALVD